ncbi:TetR/AcrR family transcriptional regulator [Hamadaea tsunoensis]|uniref:TetR/AcrR family transcriptional regulator n=1 Tax=Hamadaea tsunoensis TaxID=53368 RepID=UPI0003F654B7|nr:TetR/AcrR family transcriptional regulator [Hamadaea tsunoensis]
MADTRRRGAELERAILRAAVEELTENGYAGLTMDRVARRAGTNKNAIYRRWSSRAALGLSAYRELIKADREPADTGTLRGDVLELLRGANRQQSANPVLGGVIRGLLAAAAEDPELAAQLRENVLDAGSGLWLTVLGRAVARGEIRPEALHPRVATVGIVLLRNEYVARGTTAVSDEVIEEIVDEVYLPLVRGR